MEVCSSRLHESSMVGDTVLGQREEWLRVTATVEPFCVLGNHEGLGVEKLAPVLA